MQKIKEYVEKNVKQKLDAKAERILLLKQAKINTIKCLRKFTDHSKTSFEDLFKENFDLKKKVLDMDAQIKILKVALAKFHKRLKKAGGPEKFEESFNSFGSGVRESQVNNLTCGAKSPVLGVSSHSGRPSGKVHIKSRISTSTAASESNEEKLAMELAALKKEYAQREHDTKIQMSRMKTFYDKHLLELNQMKMNMPAVTKKSEPKSEEIQKYEVELRGLRSKIQTMKDDSRKVQDKLDEKDAKITELRNRITNQGFTKLSKVIEDMKVELDAAKKTIAEKDVKILEVDNLDYQVHKVSEDEGRFVKNFLQVYFMAKRLGLGVVLTEATKKAIVFVDDTIYSRACKLIRSLYLMFEEKVLSSVTDTQSIITSMVDNWRTQKGDGLIQDTLEENALLKQRVADLTENLQEARLRADMLMRTNGSIGEFIADKERFKKVAMDYREIDRQLEQEEAMPDHIKDEVKKLRLEHCHSKVSFWLYRLN